MKKTLAAAIMMLTILTLTGCGHDHHNPPPTVITNILSDPTIDGYIQVPITGPTIITQGTTSVLAGVDPVTGTESRAFLDFDLSGPNGVPLNAIIVSATLDIVIDSIQPPAGTIPIRIDLISFPPPLITSDFDLGIQPALAITTLPILSTDVNHHVIVDVTSLMEQAQNLSLPDFQVRILEDLRATAPGLIEIDEGLNLVDLAPLLTVEYF